MTELSSAQLEQILPGIRKALAVRNVTLAYLHGSYATATTTPLSDFDIAILLPRNTPRANLASIMKDLTYEISQFIPGIEVDLQVLNHAPVEFRYNVIKNGRVIFCLNDAIRDSFETWTLIEYLDFKYALDMYYSFLHKRLIMDGAH